MLHPQRSASLVQKIVGHDAAEGVGKNGDGATIGEKGRMTLHELCELLVECETKTIQDLYREPTSTIQ